MTTPQAAKKYPYCPQCGTKGSVSWRTPSTARCSRCGSDMWNNPSATVAVVFRDGDKVLFAKRGIEPNKGKYDLPGGFVEYNEDIYAACVRETKEETGITIKPEDLTLITGYSQEYLPEVSVVDLVFTVSRWDGKFVAQDDVAALEWKPISFIDDSDFVPDYPGLADKLLS